MSDLFTVSDEVLNPKNQNRNIKLNNDLLEGFKTSAENGQIRLALEYMIHMFNIINNKLENLNEPKKATPKIVLTSEAEVTNETETDEVEPVIPKKTAKKQEVLTEKVDS